MLHLNYECKLLSLQVIISMKEERYVHQITSLGARSLNLMNSLEPPKVVNNLSNGLRRSKREEKLPIGYFDRCFLVKKVSSLLRGHLLQDEGREISGKESVLSSALAIESEKLTCFLKSEAGASVSYC